MPRPCLADHRPSPDTCRLCWLREHDPAYAALWGEDGQGGGVSASTSPAPIATGPCRHLGADTGVDIPCDCRHRGVVRVYRCGHPQTVGGVCTLAARAGPIAVCAGCPRKETVAA